MLAIKIVIGNCSLEVSSDGNECFYTEVSRFFDLQELMVREGKPKEPGQNCAETAQAESSADCGESSESEDESGYMTFETADSDLLQEV